MGALIRPGRIDMKVHFSRMRGGDILDMFRHYFELDPPVSVRVEDLPDLKWSPAEVTQVFLNNMHDPEAALNQLITSDTLENIHLKSKEEQALRTRSDSLVVKNFSELSAKLSELNIS